MHINILRVHFCSSQAWSSASWVRALNFALTGPGSDVWHVNQGAGVLDEGGVVDRHTCAEALRVPSLVELCVCHRYSGFIFTCKESTFIFTTAEHKQGGVTWHTATLPSAALSRLFSHRFAWCLLCLRSAAAPSGCRCATAGPEAAPSPGCQSCGCFYW